MTTQELQELEPTVPNFVLLMVENSPLDFNLSKLAEELSEMLEAVLKFKNRNKPALNDTKMLAEYGDIMLRATVVFAQLFPEQYQLIIDKRMEYKAGSLIKMAKKGMLRKLEFKEVNPVEEVEV